MIEERESRAGKKSITVLQLLPELEGGGVERGSLELGKFLVRHGHTSFVVSGGGRLVSQLEREGSIHVTMPVGVKSPRCLKCILQLRRLIQKEKINILHLRSRLPAWVGYLAWISLPPKKRPILITTFHGFYSVSAYSAIMTKGKTVIAVSEAIKDHIKTAYGRIDGVTTIFRGVDGDNFNPEIVEKGRLDALRTQWDLDRHKPIIMLPGRFSRWKGQDIFIQSLTALADCNYQAILVGDTRENPRITEELQEIITQNDLHDRVKMVGHCQDMPAAYMMSDLVISASSSEPEAFGRVSIEAMAMGKPVIATAHGGSLETVVPNETGWLIQPADVNDMARAIREALSLSRESLEKIGTNGRAHVTRQFTTQAMCEQTVSVYVECLQNR